MMKRLLSVGWVVVLGMCNLRAADVPGGAAIETSKTYELQAPATRPRKAAIFVNNNAGANLNDKVPVLESAVASRLASSDFTIISRDDVLKALNVFPVGRTPQQPVVEPNAKDQNYVANRNALGTRVDRLLSDNSSALRLAQNMGADFLVIVTINSLAANESHYKDERVEFTNVEYVLQANYKVLEGVTGSALGGEDFECTKKFKISPSLTRNDGNLINELLRTAAAKIAQSCAEKTKDFKAPTVPGKVEIVIACGIRDLEGNEITLPDIRVTENNEVVKGDKTLPIQASATVEIDGLAMGTTPARIEVAPGLHKLRLMREGCKDYEAVITAGAGLRLSPTLQLSDEGFQRWRDIRAFLNGLDTQRKLTDANVKVLEGYAQYLRQSRYSVNYDIKSDVKVDTKEGLKFNLYKSLY